MIILDNVTKVYSKGKVRAVDNLNLHVKKGEIFGFIGPNGAGKTTTIKMITGILNADSGSVTVNGFDISANSIEAKKSIGYVPDSHEIYDRLSGIEYLNFIADVYDVSAEDRRITIGKYLEEFELGSAAGDLIKTYSHGMKQKLLIISALLHNPPLWILDEPLTGLDPRSSHILKQAMREHCDKGNTVFFSTHVLEVAERLCDRIGIINGGRLIAEGTLDELRSGEKGASLENIFFELTDKSMEGGEAHQ